MWVKLEFWVGILLVVYLLIFGVGAAIAVIVGFPTEQNNVLVFPPSSFPFGQVASPDQGLIRLAFLAGVAGSFLHAAQSLISFIGNGAFKARWAAWYFLRPWIGGVLGFAVYFALRAGLVAGADAVNPYGVVALGILGGWFSKTTTDKMQEVYQTLFKTDEDKHRRDKLQGSLPVVDSIDPSPIPAGVNEIVIVGRNFQEGATVLFGESELAPEFVSETELKVSLSALVRRPASGTKVSVSVENPEQTEPRSSGCRVQFG